MISSLLGVVRTASAIKLDNSSVKYNFASIIETINQTLLRLHVPMFAFRCIEWIFPQGNSRIVLQFFTKLAK